MLDRILATIARHRMLPAGSRVVAAVSGGPDSVCLLHVLREIAGGVGIEVAGVAHVNHGLRGAESEGDEQFVGEVARAHGLAFFCVRAGAGEGNLEQSLRRARREFFASLIRDGRATHVALGHTRDDQAETVLLRLLRGSGLAGLAGILPVTVEGIVRPLLGVTRAEVFAYLREHGIAWREDSSNREARFARNRVRHELLPQLRREWNPQVAESLAQLADLAFDEERIWASRVARLALIKDGEARASELAKLPVALARRVVRQAIREARGDLRGIEFEHVERVLELATRKAGAGRVDLPGLAVVRSFDWLRFGGAGKAGLAREVAIPGEYLAPDGASTVCLDILPRQGCANLDLGSLLSWRKVPDRMELRGWRAGDAYRPLGGSRERKLKEMFQQARVPSWRRAGWPILSCGDQILWAQDFGVAAGFAVEARGKVVRVRQMGVGGGSR